jgi:hypothetical protein
MAKSLGPAPQWQGTVQIDASSFEAASAAFGPRFDDEAGQIIADAMQRSAEVIQRAVIKRAKRHKQTGRLESQIRIIKPSGSGFARSMRVHSGGSVAHLVAGPVRAHRIVVSPAETAMPIKIAGFTMGFADVVQHPGMRGDPYFKAGVQNARLAVHNVMLAAGRKLTRHLADVLGGTA